MGDTTGGSRALFEGQFLRNVRLIRRRSLITVGIVALVTALFAGWAWWQTGRLSPGAIMGRIPSTSQDIQLAERLSQAITWLTMSVRLFAATLFAVILGVVILIVAYARQTRALLDMIGRRRTAGEDSSSGPRQSPQA